MAEREPERERTRTEAEPTGTGTGKTKDPHAETSIGPEANVLAAISYLLPLLGLVFFLMEDDNDYARFHGIQAFALSITLTVLWIGVFFLLVLLSIILGAVSDILGTIMGLLVSLSFPVLALVIFLVVVFMIYKAYSGDYVKLPVIGGFCEGLL